jgi:Fe-S cluster assembly iron-binding protein IscA
MLTMTPSAETMLADTRAKKGAPSDFGVRFFAKTVDDSDRMRLAFRFVASPQPEDTVIEDGRLKAFVAPDVAEKVGDVVVDVEPKDDGPGLVVKRVRHTD